MMSKKQFRWESIPISRKITFIMSAIVLVILGLSLVAGYALSSTVSTFSNLVDNETTMMQYANVAKINLLRCRRDEKDLLYTDDSSLTKSFETFSNTILEQGRLISALVGKTNDPALSETVDKFIKNIEAYKGSFGSYIAAPVGQSRLRAAIPMRRAANEADKLLDDFIDKIGDRIIAVKDRTMNHAKRMEYIVVALGMAMVVVGIFFGVLLSLSIVGPLHKLRDRMISIAKGEFEKEVPFLSRSDEIGSMAQAVQVFKDNGIENEKLRRSQEIERQKAEQDKKVALDTLANHFESSVKGVVRTVLTTSAQMQQNANKMSSIAEQTTRQADTVSSSSEQAFANVQSVASAAEELSTSINEVLRQVQESSSVSQHAVEDALKTNNLVTSLAETVNKIGDVANLINSIAGQTNLLALNATIEAARAGDAGKGFAVVATEVKNLAAQTARATEEIGTQISAVQAATKTAVDAIGGITHTIENINSINATVAQAVEQQRLATDEIARNVVEASNRSKEVSNGIGTVSHAAKETTESVGQVLKSSSEMLHQGEILQSEIEKTKSMVASLSKG